MSTQTRVIRLLARCTLPATLTICLVGCQQSTTPELTGATPSRLETPMAGIDLVSYLDCAREQGVTLLQAHRAGDRPGAAENSLNAMRASLADGAVFMEIDVASTQDGVLVLMHDDTLDRTTTGTGTLASLPYQSITGLTLVDETGADTGEPIPTLAEALRALEGAGIAQIDRKRSVSFDAVAEAIEAADAVERVVVITYSIDDAISLHRRLPGAMISTGVRSLEDVETLQSAGVDLTRITAWLGLGVGKPALDAKLADLKIETSYGDFRAESNGTADYLAMARNGAEVISVDNVASAAKSLSARDTAQALLRNCH